MLWILQLSPLGDSEAGHVGSQFLLVLLILALFSKAVLKKEYQVTNLLVDEEGLVVSVLVEEEDH